MLLGLSSSDDEAIDISTITGQSNDDGGVAHGALLARFAERIHDGTDLEPIRQEVAAAVGEAGLVDAAAVCANFNMMVRIADGTGTPLDEGTVEISDEFREELALNDLPSMRIQEASA